MIETIINKNISRRDFLSKAAIGFFLLNPFLRVYAETSKKPSYSEVKENADLRQDYLDKFLLENATSFPHIKSLTYKENPRVLFIEKILQEELAKKEKGFKTIFINTGKLLNSFSCVISETSDYGKKSKSDVYVFPRAFEQLLEDEFRIVIFHENNHCKDVAEGIKINNEGVDAKKLERVLEPITELRADYNELEHILSLAVQAANQKQTETFLKKVRFKFVQEREDDYVHNYLLLKKILEKEYLSNEEKEAIEKHLLSYDKYMIEESRYKKK